MIPLLEAIELSKHFSVPSGPFSKRAVLRAVDDVTLSVHRGETLGLVGESGCGKSTLGRSLLNLHPVTAGEVRFEGKSISALRERDMRKLRPRMQMVFQDPYGSLNPRRRVADLIAEPLRVHQRSSTKWRSAADIAARVQDLIDIVGLRAEHLQRYPHEFSGGQRQRIGIARALALEPALIVADEPVSALDVSIQAQIVNLLMDLQERFSLTYVFVAHDLAVVRQIATRTAVMYLGSIVEIGPTMDLFAAPAHPYTAALLASVPRAHEGGHVRALSTGEIPSPIAPPPGCRFHPRCATAQARCREDRPALLPVADGRQVACHFPLTA
jgi:peptide/nickel transport system ATP-binding protein